MQIAGGKSKKGPKSPGKMLDQKQYCWWTKSCTTKDDDYPMICRVSYIQVVQDFVHQQYH